MQAHLRGLFAGEVTLTGNDLPVPASITMRAHCAITASSARSLPMLVTWWSTIRCLLSLGDVETVVVPTYRQVREAAT